MTDPELVPTNPINLGYDPKMFKVTNLIIQTEH